MDPARLQEIMARKRAEEEQAATSGRGGPVLVAVEPFRIPHRTSELAADLLDAARDRRLTGGELLVLFEEATSGRPGPHRPRAALAPQRSRGGHLRRRPQRHLHQPLLRRLQVLRVQSAPGRRRRLLALPGRDPDQVPHGGGGRRHPDPAAGRASSQAAPGLLRENAAAASRRPSRRSGSTASRPTRSSTSRGSTSCPTRNVIERLQAAGLDSIPAAGPRSSATACGGSWRRGKTTRRRTGSSIMEEAHWLGLPTTVTMMFQPHRDLRRARRASAAHAREPGPHRRLHRLHPLDLPARAHAAAADARTARAGRGSRLPGRAGLPAHPRRSAASPWTISATSRPPGSPRARPSASSRSSTGPTTWAPP